MNLIFDIGNTKIKYALFEGKELKQRWAMKKLSFEALDALYEEHNIDGAALLASGSIPEGLNEYLTEKGKYIKLDHKIALPIKNGYKTPETLGRDRIAAVVGAHDLYPDQNVLVIDAGTCITYDFLQADGLYLGGAIAPGIRLRYKAMHHFTAKLPLVKRQRFDDFVGYNTETCMQVGGQVAAALEMQGFIDAYLNRYHQLIVIITGGDTEYFVSQLKSKIFAIPNLVLIGLNKILNYNNAKTLD